VTAAEKRIRVMLNRLALAPVTTCRILRTCAFCNTYIRPGELYRNRGVTAQAHENCFHAVRREYQ
jgi:hypothetical protein